MTDVWRALLAAGEAGEHVALATVIGVDGSAPRAAGARMLVWPDGRTLGTIGGGNFELQVTGAAIACLAEGRPRRYAVHLTRDLGMCCGGAMEVYIEPMGPRERMILFGAGHVARPTARLAAELGFDVTVVDEREEYANAERFPGAALVTGDPRRWARALQTDARTYILIVTHDHSLDQDLLEILLPRTWAWLGLIGSRAKVAKFFIRLRAAGLDEQLFSRVSAPVGLDLGAETPEEIAVAIAAEVVRVRRGVTRAPVPLSALPLPARGGDRVARPPGAAATENAAGSGASSPTPGARRPT
ncbi:MAG: xanthine dehydrogenase accessory protein XdhC [Pseudomonadota bacterium]|nr:xanthine dehydrogenase accessory protein XdhC [Pseudomonadota bacterium]